MSIDLTAPAVAVEEQPRRKRAAWRPLAAAAVAGSVLVATGFGVWASLSASATNTTPQSVSTGTLTLKLENNVTGFGQSIANLAPTDVVNRYVTVTNTGTLEGRDLSMAVAATGSPVLISGDKALRLSVESCSVAWNAATGACGGTITPMLAETPLAGLSTARPLGSTPAIAAGAPVHLKISAALPDATELSVNGALPAGTIQNAKADLTYTFTQVQRAGTTTNS